ncbi:hypothetical protein ASPZODRAFT_137132 [Penicilliopsis zonata CBS 506.65]|uniref:Uncharacterized protein n=1 Tax=Penicilliopsis zonata CBS 506.65 TaxID=1073090 RepID=A0A1L9S6H3_9EURO|nr:hypothetical protein ASPZODRAFT_137132 [Penicilliopsis zonata CBS 506.65]OJJ42737.1 hypothetical protein ASPZODRAFT_137132 [Penicilliopsis zonata CBS 506.65]
MSFKLFSLLALLTLGLATPIPPELEDYKTPLAPPMPTPTEPATPKVPHYSHVPVAKPAAAETPFAQPEQRVDNNIEGSNLLSALQGSSHLLDGFEVGGEKVNPLANLPV